MDVTFPEEKKLAILDTMDMLLLVIIILYGISALYESVIFATVWKERAYDPKAFFAWLPTTFGKEVLKSFPVGGRMIFSAGIAYVMLGMTARTLHIGILFILLLSLSNNMCSCTRTRFRLPRGIDRPLISIALASFVIESIIFLLLPDSFTLDSHIGMIPYAILFLSSIRFVLVAVVATLLSPITHSHHA